MLKIPYRRLLLLASALSAVPAFGQVIHIPGTTNATQINGSTVPTSAPYVGTDANGAVIAATAPAAGAQGAQGVQGIQGVPGATGATGAAGQGFIFQGAWVANTAYPAYSVVVYNGQAYTSKAALAAASTFSTTTWTLFTGTTDSTYNTTLGGGQAASGKDNFPMAGCTAPSECLAFVSGQGWSRYHPSTGTWARLLDTTDQTGGSSSGSTSSASTVYNILTDTADGNTYSSTSAYGGTVIATATSAGIANVILTDASDGNHYSLTSAYGGYRLTPTSTTTGAISSYSYTDRDGHTYKLGSSYGGLVKTPTS